MRLSLSGNKLLCAGNLERTRGRERGAENLACVNSICALSKLDGWRRKSENALSRKEKKIQKIDGDSFGSRTADS